MGTIKNGFWSLSFILSPSEFISFIKYCDSLEIRFDRKDVDTQYELFYNALISRISPKILLEQGSVSFVTLKSFACMLSINGGIGISITPANQMWLDYDDNAGIRISDWAIRINLQKGVSVDKEDERGKYFVYEDIQQHSPGSYLLYQKLTTYIKSMTKALRFETQNGEVIKSPVRISQQVAIDLKSSWIFTNFRFKMISFI